MSLIITITLCEFLDLHKAFDAINNGVLIEKLKRCGTRGVAANWIHNYLSNRYQYFCSNGFNSEILPIIYDILQ